MRTFTQEYLYDTMKAGKRQKGEGEMRKDTGQRDKGLLTIVLAAAFTVMLFMLSGEKVKADGPVEVNTWSGLQAAIDAAPAGTETTIKLTGDIAPADPGNSNAIGIGGNRNIVLDLNGHIIDRKLENAVPNGSVIVVTCSAITLTDSAPDSDHSAYQSSSGAIGFTGGGIIGGNTTENGGGMLIKDSECIITAGTIASCTASQNGRGIYVDSDGLILITGGNFLNLNIDDPGADLVNKQVGAAVVQIEPKESNTYTGAETELLYKKTDSNITVYYYISTDNAAPGAIDFNAPQSNGWSLNSKAVFPGTYNAWVAVIGANGKTAGPVKITPSPSISPISASFQSRPSAVQDLVYDGTAKTLINEGSFSSGNLIDNTLPTVLYAVTQTNVKPADSAYSADLPSRTEAGTSYVWYRIEESNYYNPENRYPSITVEIRGSSVNPAPSTVEPGPDPEKDENVTTRTVRNADGSVTTVTTVRNPDGSATATEMTKYEDGSYKSVSETKDKDGKLLTRTEETKTVSKKGTAVVTTKTVNAGGSTLEKTVKTTKKGYVETTEVASEITKKGNTLVSLTMTDSDGYALSMSFTIKKGKVTLTSFESTEGIVTIPDEITINGETIPIAAILREAFRNNTDITNVTIGKNVTVIGTKAFYGATNLKRIIICGDLEKVGKGAFRKIASDAVIRIRADKENYKRIVELIKKSGIEKGVKFKRIK